MCDHGLQSQCETTQNRQSGTGGSLFGYTKLYGQVPGGQAELLRVPHADYGPIKVPEGPPDDRFVYLSDVLPTAWQAVEWAEVPPGGSLVVLGLGPIGDMACRIARHRGIEVVIGIDRVPERLARARERGIDVLDLDALDADKERIADAVRDRTDGRGADAVIDAVGMEAHGSPLAKLGHKVVGLMPDRVAEKLMSRAGTDRLAALQTAIEVVRRGGTISVIGVYGGMTDPAAHAHLVRQADPPPHGPGQRAPLGRRPASPRRRRRPARLGRVRHPPASAGRGTRRLRHVPEQAGRRGQGALPALRADFRLRRGGPSTFVVVRSSMVEASVPTPPRSSTTANSPSRAP